MHHEHSTISFSFIRYLSDADIFNFFRTILLFDIYCYIVVFSSYLRIINKQICINKFKNCQELQLLSIHRIC